MAGWLGRAIIKPQSLAEYWQSQHVLHYSNIVVHASQPDNSNTSAGPIVPSNLKPAVSLETGIDALHCTRHKSGTNRGRDAPTDFLWCVLVYEAVRQACAVASGTSTSGAPSPQH